MTTNEESELIERLNADHAISSKRVQRFGDAEREAMRKLPTCPTYAEELILRLDIAKAKYEIALEMMTLHAIQSQMTKVYHEVAEREAKEKA